MKEEIAEILEESDGWLTTKEIAKRLNIRKDVVSSAMPSLVKQKRVNIDRVACPFRYSKR